MAMPCLSSSLLPEIAAEASSFGARSIRNAAVARSPVGLGSGLLPNRHLKCATSSGSSLLRLSAKRAGVSTALFSFGKKKEAVTVRPTVVPDPDFRIAAVLFTSAGLLISADQKLGAAPIGLLGLLLLVQTTRVRFKFDEDSLEVVIGEKLEKSGENVFVGGENKWRYDTFTNWEFWWPGFPVLVYFKETQMKPEGQIHFFPIIADGKKLYEVMVERCGPSQNSAPPSP
eukprot:TRINITY_DN1146_c0_g1_i5.p1 TRINITY_DN1146_c0_g1~~TRINITY_DN1146_c0_g1_i5.p1  ORF type:complete len:229 (-),score=58.08 TRINITY_DN1146_c0_g1_i5:790-1476(-)